MARFLRSAVVGADGKLRLGLRAAVFYLVNVYVVYPLLAWPTGFAAKALSLRPEFSAAAIALNGVHNLVAVLFFLGLFAAYERWGGEVFTTKPRKHREYPIV